MTGPAASFVFAFAGVRASAPAGSVAALLTAGLLFALLVGRDIVVWEPARAHRAWPVGVIIFSLLLVFVTIVSVRLRDIAGLG